MKHLIRALPALLALSFISYAQASDHHDIRGVVRNADNEVVEDVRVRLLKSEGRGHEPKVIDETSTDKHGEFKFKKVAAGDYMVDAHALDHHKNDLHAIRHVDISDDDADDVEITLHEGKGTADVVSGRDTGYTTIDGIVRDSDKQPIKGAKVYLLGKIKGEDKFKILDQDVTDKKGFFEFYNVADGSYTVEARVGDEKRDREVKLADGERIDRLEFTMKH